MARFMDYTSGDFYTQLSEMKNDKRKRTSKPERGYRKVCG
jgi:hypothetical protein